MHNLFLTSFFVAACLPLRVASAQDMGSVDSPQQKTDSRRNQELDEEPGRNVQTIETYATQGAAQDGTAQEKADELNLFLAGFFRYSFVPKAIVELFEDFDTLPTMRSPAVGLEVMFHWERFDLSFEAAWQGFRTSGPYRITGQPIWETEFLDSDINMLFVGTTIRGTIPFHRVIALQYGLGVGVSGVFGELRRNEAYVDENGDWQVCNGPDDPGPDPFCDSTRTDDPLEPGAGHYGQPVEKWNDGGQVPNIYFRFAPQVSLRITPVPRFLIRFDTGFDIFSGFFVGAALGVGIY